MCMSSVSLVSRDRVVGTRAQAMFEDLTTKTTPVDGVMLDDSWSMVDDWIHEDDCFVDSCLLKDQGQFMLTVDCCWVVMGDG